MRLNRKKLEDPAGEQSILFRGFFNVADQALPIAPIFQGPSTAIGPKHILDSAIPCEFLRATTHITALPKPLSWREPYSFFELLLDKDHPGLPCVAPDAFSCRQFSESHP